MKLYLFKNIDGKSYPHLKSLKLGRNELYTKLYTLSTRIMGCDITDFMVTIGTDVLERSHKNAESTKKSRKIIDFSNVKNM